MSNSTDSVQKLLNKFDVPTLQHRHLQFRLTFFHKVVEGLVPAIPVKQLLAPDKPGRLAFAKNPILQHKQPN